MAPSFLLKLKSISPLCGELERTFILKLFLKYCRSDRSRWRCRNMHEVSKCVSQETTALCFAICFTLAEYFTLHLLFCFAFTCWSWLSSKKKNTWFRGLNLLRFRKSCDLNPNIPAATVHTGTLILWVKMWHKHQDVMSWEWVCPTHACHKHTGAPTPKDTLWLSAAFTEEQYLAPELKAGEYTLRWGFL